MKFYLTLICLFLIVASQAQDYQKRAWMPLENRIGLAFGIGSFTFMDKNASPLVYQSKPKNVRLFYNLETNQFLFSVDFDFKFGSVQTKHHNRTVVFHEYDYKGKDEGKKIPAVGSLLAGRISLGAFYKIPSTQESTFKAAVGARVMNELFYPQGWTSTGLFNALSFSPEGLAQHKVNEHHAFTASVRIPLITNLTRLPYDNTVSVPNENKVGGFFKNAQWTKPDKFLAPAFSVEYQYQFNSRWGAGVHYDWTWYNVKTPQPMKAINQSLLASFHHQF